MPNGVWEQLATDFHGPLPSGDYLMLTIDEFSRFPIIKSLKSINADNVIKIWKETFQIFGYPKEIKTDNGPPFQSYKVRKFMLDNNIKHRKITPLWPRANAICERFMRNINRVMKNSKVNHSNWREELNLFLSHYRATPHDSTGVAPAKLMFKSQSSSSGLPIIFKLKENEEDIERMARDKDFRAKEDMKKQMDKRLNSKNHSFGFGDRVYVKSAPGNKSTPRFDPEPYSIVNIKVSMIEAEKNGKRIVRNCSFFRKFHQNQKIKVDLEPIPIIEISSSPVIPYSLITNNRSDSSLVINSHQDFQNSDFNQSTDHPDSSNLDKSNIEDKFQVEHEIKLSRGDSPDDNNPINNKQVNNDEDEDEDEVEDDDDDLMNNEEESEKELSEKRIRKPPKRYSDSEENERAKSLKEKQRINMLDIIDSI